MLYKYMYHEYSWIGIKAISLQKGKILTLMFQSLCSVRIPDRNQWSNAARSCWDSISVGINDTGRTGTFNRICRLINRKTLENGIKHNSDQMREKLCQLRLLIMVIII